MVKSAPAAKRTFTQNTAEAVREGVLGAGLGFAVASEWMFAPELISGEVRRMLSGFRQWACGWCSRPGEMPA